MYLVSGTFREKPQETHLWNLKKINSEKLTGGFISFDGLTNFSPRRGILFHIPIVSGWGWKKYVVLSPADKTDGWFVGWISNGRAEISLKFIHGPVRMLLGPDQVRFFGLNHLGHQIAIKQIGDGVIGQGGPYAKVKLL